MKKIALIGSTGSIGRQTVAVCARYPERFRIVAMAANASEERFAAQVRSVRPAFAALQSAVSTDSERAKKLARILHAQALLIAGEELEDPAGYAEDVCSLF